MGSINSLHIALSHSFLTSLLSYFLTPPMGHLVVFFHEAHRWNLKCLRKFTLSSCSWVDSHHLMPRRQIPCRITVSVSLIRIRAGPEALLCLCLLVSKTTSRFKKQTKMTFESRDSTTSHFKARLMIFSVEIDPLFYVCIIHMVGLALDTVPTRRARKIFFKSLSYSKAL